MQLQNFLPLKLLMYRVFCCLAGYLNCHHRWFKAVKLAIAHYIYHIAGIIDETFILTNLRNHYNLSIFKLIINNYIQDRQ